MKDMTVETLNFIILCMGLLFVMAGIFLIVGKLAGKRPASIAVGVLMIAWGLLCGIPESRSWMLARATDLEHLLEAMWAGLDGDGQMLVYIFALWLMGAIVIMVEAVDDIDRRIVRNIGGPGPDARGRIVLALGRSRASLPELWEPQGAEPPPPTGRGCQAFHAQ